MDVTRNCFLEEIKWKNGCTTLNYIEHSFILVSSITDCISAFASLLGIPTGMTSSTIVLKFVK